MAAAPRQRAAAADRRAAGIAVRRSLPIQSHAMLPAAQGRAADAIAGALRNLVHRVAPGTIAFAKKSENSGAASPAQRQDAFESESAGGLELETSLELRGRASAELLAAIRRRLLEHRLSALHRHT